jgi:hypothetical protein
MAIMLTASVFAVARIGRFSNGNAGITPTAIVYKYVEIMKTYDLYRVICDSDPCCEQGKCLGTVDAMTCLSLCGLMFSKDNTEYWVELYDEATDTWVQVGSCVDGICDPVCVCKQSEYGRVRYVLRIKTRHPDIAQTREPSLLDSATLCLAASVDNLVGSDYEQEYFVDKVFDEDGNQEIILPYPADGDVGENVILCPLCP